MGAESRGEDRCDSLLSALVHLRLSECPDQSSISANWIDSLVALGVLAARRQRKDEGRQLVITLSVPKRDFAAALIGCGWVLASEAPILADPLQSLRTMRRGQPLRAVNSTQVISGVFDSLDEEAPDLPRARFAGGLWRVDRILAVAALASKQTTTIKESRPMPGCLEHLAQHHLAWDARLALPAADLAIIGTLKWLGQDFDAYLTGGDNALPPTSIRSLLKPYTRETATWFTHLFSSARLAEYLPLEEPINAVILDGNGSIKYLGDFETPVAICVLDRSAADETAAELVVQMRNTRGEPLSLFDDLGWTPAAGIEAMAFTVAL